MQNKLPPYGTFFSLRDNHSGIHGAPVGVHTSVLLSRINFPGDTVFFYRAHLQTAVTQLPLLSVTGWLLLWS